jgi:DNA-binding MarR family transcriptional regulator
MTARQAISVEELIQTVAPKGSGEDQMLAFNLCDGSRGQSEIAKEVKLDPGNFSRTVARWVEAGIVIRMGEGREAKLLHIYPISRDRIGRVTCPRVFGPRIS